MSSPVLPVYITATSAFLPNDPVDNDHMETVLGQAGGRPSRARRTILRSNGIVNRHYALNAVTREFTHTNAQLAAAAVKQLPVTNGDVHCLACGTSIADQLMPGHASMVQGELGWPACEVVSTGGVCVAGMTALRYAMNAVRCGDVQRAVATGSELASASMRAESFGGESMALISALEQQPELAFEQDFLRWMLSDGAGAVLLESEPRAGACNLRLDWLDILSYAGEMDTCMYAGAVKQPDGHLRGWQSLLMEARTAEQVFSVKQDVKLLNEQVIAFTVEKPLQQILAKRALQADDIDFFLPHYSSAYFRDRVDAGLQRAGLPIPPSRWFTNLPTRGNTGSASIFIMLDELVTSGRLRPGHRLLCYVPESGRFSTAFMHLTVV